MFGSQQSDRRIITDNNQLMENRYAQANSVSSFDELKQIDIFGNAYHDMPIFEAADRLVLKLTDPQEQCDVLNYVAVEVMGIDDQLITPDQIPEYMATLLG